MSGLKTSLVAKLMIILLVISLIIPAFTYFQP